MFESLEPRQLLAADCVDYQPLTPEPADVEQVAAAEVGHDDTDAIQQESVERLDLPTGLPAQFSATIVHEGETLTLQLDKSSVYGENTRFLVDNGSGELVEVDPGVDRSYLGSVAEHADFVVSAVLTNEGLFANIIRPNQVSIAIEPLLESVGSGLHKVSVGEAAEQHSDHDGQLTSVGEDLQAGDDTGSSDETAASTSPITTTTIPAVAAAMTSGATLPPTRVMDVYEYEVGVEIGSPAFTVNYSSLSQAMSVAAGIPNNLNARFLNSAGIRHRLGTVIIRQTAAEDKFTVANGNDNAGLSAFRNYWNANPGEVGNTHDLAVYHVRASPSGLAYVNSVGGNSRYALTASNGPTSWADGTLAHEFGHSWNLGHVNSSLFYESKPRSNGNVAGGSDVFVSIMHGGGSHNIGRLATDEANRVYNARQGKLGFGDLISNPGPIKPFGHRDSATSNGTPLTIDVIANDYDVNNDVLNVQLRDTVSQQGATISLSAGTGPGGRDEILYTPAAGSTGTDFFHYTVVDSTGRTDWGAVYVENTGPTIVDLTQTQYFYDVGTPTSPIFTGNNDPYQRISPDTFGDISFVSNGPNPVESRDRGTAGGANDINRDHVRLRSASTFEHRLADGKYRVLLTVGDATENTASIRLTAEDSVTLTTASHVPATFTNYVLQDVEVTDGTLTLNIENLGFSSNITRINIERTGDAELRPTVTSSVRDGGALDGSDLSRPDVLNTLAVSFDQDVDINVNDLSIFNVSQNGTSAALSGINFSYNSITFVASWDLSNLLNPLPAAFYQYLLNPAIKGTNGLPLQGNSPSGLHIEDFYLAIPGDADLDGDVDVLSDAAALVQNLGASSGQPWSNGDFDGDGDVDVLSDAAALVQNLGGNVQPPQAFAAIAFAAQPLTQPSQSSTVPVAAFEISTLAGSYDAYDDVFGTTGW